MESCFRFGRGRGTRGVEWKKVGGKSFGRAGGSGSGGDRAAGAAEGGRGQPVSE